MPLPAAQDLQPGFLASAPATLGGALLPGQTQEGLPTSQTVRLTDQRNPLALEQARVWWNGIE
jgi:hypothetical protein